MEAGKRGEIPLAVATRIDGSLTWPVSQPPPTLRSWTGSYSDSHGGKQAVHGNPSRVSLWRGRHRSEAGSGGGGDVPPSPEVWLEPRFTREFLGSAPRSRCLFFSPIDKFRPMRAGRREGVGPRLSPNGHLKNVLALLSLPPREGGRKARGPHSFLCTRVSNSALSGRGQLFPPVTEVCLLGLC